jgi:hypothetical protein
MNLEGIVDDELVQPLRGAIVAEDMIATRQLIESISLEVTKTPRLEEVKVYAESYILELRDGEQYKSPPTLESIRTWIEAKGLDGVLDPAVVLGTILAEGTTWDRKGGSAKLQEVLNPDNIQRIMNIAVEASIDEIKRTQWQLR